MDLISSIFSGFGLSASAGLNAYIPLLMLGILNRYTGLVDLAEPYSAISSGWALGTLGVLVVIEVFADNVPLVNHVNDAIQTVVRPAAGALVFAASTDVADVNPALAIVAGLLVAGSVHATKAVVVRPAVTATTGGLGNTPVSVTEDFLSASVSFLSILIPIIVGLFLVITVGPIAWWRLRRRRQTAAR
ncbi:MAG: DUF4126 domain-containing protein [Acidimicrobiia bacterium]|nr:DUF4126 domain-containing protein [Acidimicrobiia bacterium]